MPPDTKTALKILAATAIFSFSIYILHRQITGLSPDKIADALRATPHWRIVVAGMLTAISFLALAMYEVYAAASVDAGGISARRAAFAGATGNAFSNTLGFHAVTGGAIRCRIYLAQGVSLGDTLRIFALAGAGIAMGFVAVIILSCLFSAGGALSWKHLAGFFAGCTLLLLFARLPAAPARIRILKWNIAVPEKRVALKMAALGVVEMGAAVGALYVLLPPASLPTFPDFMLLYVGAIGLGIISSVPGGIGVFEATMVAGMPGASLPELLAALALYRLVYNLFPFALAAAGYLLYETRYKRGPVSLMAGSGE